MFDKPPLSASTAAPVTLALFLVALLSFSYRFLKTLDHTSARPRRRLTAFHALATESLQGVILVLGVSSTVGIYMTVFSSEDALHTWRLSGVGFRTGVSEAGLMVIAANLALHLAAFYAVDLIEARILLGRWRHPYRGWGLVVTRSWFMLWRKNGRVRGAAEASGGEKGCWVCRELGGLEWLDLAVPAKTSRALAPISEASSGIAGRARCPLTGIRFECRKLSEQLVEVVEVAYSAR